MNAIKMNKYSLELPRRELLYFGREPEATCAIHCWLDRIESEFKAHTNMMIHGKSSEHIHTNSKPRSIRNIKHTHQIQSSLQVRRNKKQEEEEH